MKPPIDDRALNQLFRTARSHNGWKDEPVSDAQLRTLYDLVKRGPTNQAVMSEARSSGDQAKSDDSDVT